jgi:RimJ/RimL family protein N-acetyltransferase
MLEFPTAPLLPDEVLTRRTQLPLKPTPLLVDDARYVRLEPLDLARHLEALYTVSNGSAIQIAGRTHEAYDPDERIWRYMSGGPFANREALAAWLRPQIDAPNGLALCVIDLAINHPIGVANFMANSPEHLKIELGSIWYSPLAQRTNANTETTYRMLAHAFWLGYRRVEWKCDALNERSRRAALRMGFKFEGIQEFHYIIKGRSRDTAWFRVLDHEWANVKERLEIMLYP